MCNQIMNQFERMKGWVCASGVTLGQAAGKAAALSAECEGFSDVGNCLS